MRSTPVTPRSSFLGSALGKLADNAAAFFNGMVGRENTITGVHVEIAGGAVALGMVAYALSRPNVRNSLYQVALGLLTIQVGRHSVTETNQDSPENISSKKKH